MHWNLNFGDKGRIGRRAGFVPSRAYGVPNMWQSPWFFLFDHPFLRGLAGIDGGSRNYDT
eukprot:4720638-Amphidinium_carterae.1